MRPIRFIHWKEEEAERRAKRLLDAGYRVDYAPFDSKDLTQMRRDPPAVLVIDLSRLPATGRDVAMAVRSFKATANLPIVMVGGASEKVAKFKKQLPGVAFVAEGRMLSAVRRAIANFDKTGARSGKSSNKKIPRLPPPRPLWRAIAERRCPRNWVSNPVLS